MFDVSFKPANITDAEALNNLRCAAIQCVKDRNPHIVKIEQAFDWQQKDSLDRMCYFTKDPNRYVEIALTPNHEIIGYSIVHQNELERLFVHPSYQNKGIGSNLLQRAESRILDHQKKQNLPLVIKVDSFVTSRNFYENLGYVAIWSRKFNLDNSIIHTYWMVKSLEGLEIRPERSQMTLSIARKKIDEYDREINNLLMRRFAVTEWVGEHKASQGLSSYDEDREIFQRVTLEAISSSCALPSHLIQSIFTLVRDESKLNHFHVRESSHFSSPKK